METAYCQATYVCMSGCLLRLNGSRLDKTLMVKRRMTSQVCRYLCLPTDCDWRVEHDTIMAQANSLGMCGYTSGHRCWHGGSNSEKILMVRHKVIILVIQCLYLRMGHG